MDEDKDRYIKKLEQQLENFKLEIMVLYKIIHSSTIINSSLNIEETLENILENGLDAVYAKKGSLMLFDEKYKKLKIRVAKGLSKETVEKTEISAGEGISGTIFDEKIPYLYNPKDKEQDPHFQLMRQNSDRDQAFMCVPLISKRGVIGVINISEPIGKDSFSEKDFGIIIALASQATIAIENSELYKKINVFTYETILALSQAIEAKDPYTEGHCERVTQYCYSVAKEYGGFSEEDLIIIQYGAMLHDIGKIGIKPEILNKPGGLSNEEFEEMKKHPDIGATIVDPISYMGIVKTCVQFHHVWFDGKGYPTQTNFEDEKAKQMANIIGVCDVYDALTSDRAYRKKMPYEKAKEILLTGKGTQFDPKAVDILIDQVEHDRIAKSDFILMKSK